MHLNEVDPQALATEADVNILTAVRFLQRIRNGEAAPNTTASRKMRTILARRGLLPPITPPLPHPLPLDAPGRERFVGVLAQIIACLDAPTSAMLADAVAQQVATARAELEAQGRAVPLSA
jgi:hypothetical protein